MFAVRRAEPRQCRLVLAVINEAERRHLPISNGDLVHEVSAEMSQAAVNRALNALEQVGLIVRVPACTTVTNGHLVIDWELKLTGSGRAATRCDAD